MLRAIVKKELLGHLASFRFLFTTALAAVLVALATLVGAEDYGARHDRYLAKLDEERRALVEIRTYSFLQPLAVRPPEPLAIFDRGFEGRLGDEVRIHLFEIPFEARGEHRGNPFLTALRGFDLTTVVQLVLGLQALLLTFDAVVGERERGTLKLLLAQGVARSRLLAGKLLGAGLASAGALATLVAIALATLRLGSDVGLDASDALRLAALVVAYAVYLGVMLWLGLVLSLVARSASQALASAALAWLVLAFVLPQAALTAAVGLDPAEPAAAGDPVAEAERQRNLLLRRIWDEDPLRAERSGHSSIYIETTRHRAVLRRYGSARFYDALADYHRREAETGLRYAETIHALRVARERRQKGAERLLVALAFPSPAFLLERVTHSLSGTSIADHDDFLAAARAYRAELISYLRARDAFGSWRWFTDDRETRPWPSFLGLAPDDVDASNIEELDARLRSPEVRRRIESAIASADRDAARNLEVDDLPPFRFRGRGVAQALRRRAGEVSALGVYNVLLAIVAGARFRRERLV